MHNTTAYAMYVRAVEVGRKRLAENLLAAYMNHDIRAIDKTTLKRLPINELDSLVGAILVEPGSK